MTLGDTLQLTKEAVQCALDDLTSPRSSPHYQSRALQKLEYLLALACCASGIKNNSEDDKDSFFALQYTFECNVPSKMLSWITLATLKLETITNKGLMEDGRGPEVEELAAQLALSLSLIQGVALNHEPSKIYLGRKCSLEILLDLLLASRHLSLPAEPPSMSKTTSPSPPLTSVVLDTLLCILVDSCPAIRSFEEANGTQAVVKILKRAGTPREVRMKCLEFLYFYLLDETPTSLETAQSSTPSPTAPATPIRTLKPYLSATPTHPLSRYGSSTYSFSTSTSYYTSTSSLSGSGSSSSSSSSRSTSGSSAHSFSSTSSNASSSTTVSSVLSLPGKGGSTLSPAKPFSKSPGHSMPQRQQQQQPCTPPNSPPSTTAGAARFPQVRTMMLKKEVDYIPQSPKKVAGLGARHPCGHSRNLSSSTSFHSRSKSHLIPTESQREELDQLLNVSSPLKQDLEKIIPIAATAGRHGQKKWRTTEDKKELLGTMLGNVDALVEGVRKAGIWGLG